VWPACLTITSALRSSLATKSEYLLTEQDLAKV
jgi:hypothetical protein